MSAITIHNEECRIIKGFERYCVSESGNVYRIVPTNNKEKAKLEEGAVYLTQNKLHFREVKGKLRQAFCSLTNNEGKLCNLAVAALVAKAFINDTNEFEDEKHSVEFIDGDKRNIHYTNLKIVEKKYGNSKLSGSDVKKIKKLIKLGNPLKHIGETFGVSEMQISRIKTGENWGSGKRKIKAPKAPFMIEDGKIRKYVAIFNSEPAPPEIRKPFSIKRNKKDPTDNLIVGILKGYKLTLKHKNITRAQKGIEKLNNYFFS